MSDHPKVRWSHRDASQLETMIDGMKLQLSWSWPHHAADIIINLCIDFAVDPETSDEICRKGLLTERYHNYDTAIKRWEQIKQRPLVSAVEHVL